MPKKSRVKQGGLFACQFCGYEGRGWLSGGFECPKCHRDYDAILAQDSEE